MKVLRKRKRKVFCSITLLGSLLTVLLVFNRWSTLVTEKVNSNNIENISTEPSGHVNNLKEFERKEKHILLWSSADTIPFIYLGQSNSVFMHKNCSWTNCYVTRDVGYLSDYTQYDVIAFSGPHLIDTLSMGSLPRRRSWTQKYVFVSIESAANYPICTDVWNDYFNWTWTYKLNSDLIWGYMTIRNASGHEIGPSLKMNWLKQSEMDNIDPLLKNSLKSKIIAAAWFTSSCRTESLRENYVNKLQRHLETYALQLHIYGKCGQFDCPVEIMPNCLQLLKKKYYFYLAFENSLSDDYVTEKIVYAMKYDTVPIVFGGANYTRFMPEGSYLNARQYTPEKLAAKMFTIIENRTLYHEFFRWKKYYSYHYKYENSETDEYCNICALLNNQTLMQKISSYSNFSRWWSGPNLDNFCHPTLKDNNDPFYEILP